VPALRHARFLLLLICALLPGCRRREVRKVRERPSAEVAELARAAEKLDISCEDRPLAVDAAKLKQLLPPWPGLPSPFFQANVHLGEPVAPYLEKSLAREAFTAWEPPFNRGTCIGLSTTFVGSTDSAVNYITAAWVHVPRAEARALVTGLWGEPTATKTLEGEPVPIWIGRSNGFQARLVDSADHPDRSVLWIYPYLELEDLLGESTGFFGFAVAVEPGDPIGETLQLLAARTRPSPSSVAAGETDGTIWLTLPPLELYEDDTRATVEFAHGVVTRISVMLPKNDDVRGRAGLLVSKKGARFTIDEDVGGGTFAVTFAGDGTTPPPAPQSPEAVTAQCEQVIDAFWRGVQPALPLLKLDKRAGFEHEYKHAYTSERLREDCPRQSAWSRACLIKAPNALTAIKSCGIDPFYFHPPDLVAMSSVVRYRKLDADAQQRRLAELVGHWVSDDSYTKLTFAADGTVDTSFTLYKSNHFRMELDEDGRVALYDGKQFADAFTYALDGPDTLRFCVNTAFYHHGPRIGSEDSWVTWWDGDILFYDRGACTTVREQGAVVPTACAVETDPDGRRWLKLRAADWDQDARWLLLPGQFVDPACPVLHRTRN
jgi:hypothetical protein